jgi:hypothetical protein
VCSVLVHCPFLVVVSLPLLSLESTVARFVILQMCQFRTVDIDIAAVKCRKNNSGRLLSVVMEYEMKEGDRTVCEVNVFT